ncbi:SDR family oxidoreductase [Aquabacterium sp.]|uniref:SDR family oxidoreductase n=1 Tax=Aquabacterium sp. TaxID=1872578 RepID=UPI00248A252C|nr:SDR family oxidoreductase [Aquabacterium sp.]MDI1258698.1 SDR family oxidoreductase [Aquabacterium sp.]
MKDFQNKVIWITGASSGIGEALAYEFARRGALLVLSSRRADVLEGVKARCERPDQHLVLPMDMTDQSRFREQTALVLSAYSHIDMLINNAGVSQRALVKDTSIEVDRQIMELDFFGPIALTKVVLPHMLARGCGHLVAVSSVVGLVATPYRSAYASAKHAIIGFHDALRAEVHAAGLKVSVLCPGFVRTNVSLSALTSDGTPHGRVDAQQHKAMSAEAFARKAVDRLARGEGRIVIAGKEKLAVYLGRLSPALLERLVRNVSVV